MFFSDFSVLALPYTGTSLETLCQLICSLYMSEVLTILKKCSILSNNIFLLIKPFFKIKSRFHLFSSKYLLRNAKAIKILKFLLFPAKHIG